MSFHEVAVVAGSVATTIFIASYLPMLTKAARSKDLRSYSGPSLALANAGNIIQTIYVLSLPPGPLWLLQGFYLLATALMLYWWWAHQDRAPGPVAADAPTVQRDSRPEPARVPSGR